MQRISGPISAYVLEGPIDIEDDRQGHTCIFLFGDEHFSTDNSCENCDTDPDCLSIEDYVTEAKNKVANGAMIHTCDDTLDVFLEVPYVMPSGVLRDKLLGYVEHLMAHENNANSADHRERGHLSVLRKLFQTLKYMHHTAKCLHCTDSKKYDNCLDDSRYDGRGKKPCSGVLGNLFKRFRHDLYGPINSESNDEIASSSRRREDKKKVQFHACDIRWDPNVWMYMICPPTQSFHKYSRWIRDMCIYFPNTEKYRKLIESFLYSTDFDKAIHSTVGHSSLILYSALVSLDDDIEIDTYDDDDLADSSAVDRRLHPIAKQYHLLGAENKKLQTIMKHYLDSRIKEIVECMERRVIFDETDVPRECLSEDILRDADRFQALQQVIKCMTPVLMTDAYLLIRMLNTTIRRHINLSPSLSSRTPFKSRVIVYGGHSHVLKYLDLLQRFLGLKCREMHEPETHDRERKKGKNNGDVCRCVRLNTAFL